VLPRRYNLEHYRRRVLLYDLRKEFRNGTQPQFMASIPSVQRFSQHKLSTVGVITEIQPVVDFAPIFGALSNRCSPFPRIHAPDHNIHSVQPSFGVEPFRNSSQSRPQNRLSRLTRTTDLYRPISDWLKGCCTQFVGELTLDRAKCPGSLLDVRMPGVPDADTAILRDCASVTAASHHKHAHFEPQQFRVDMM
jgi:hypothetical protein